MKKYIIFSHAILVGIIACLFYVNYMKVPAVEPTISFDEEIRMVDSIAAAYSGVIYNKEEYIPKCCGYDENSPELMLFQTAVSYRNGIPKFSLVWTKVKDGEGFKLEDGYIWFFRDDGARVAERYLGKWTCSNFAVSGSSKIQHVVENPEACLSIR